MAIESALQLIVDEWADIEPRLTVGELTALARFGRVAMPGDDGAGRPLAVFRVIAVALPDNHAAWTALRSPGVSAGPRDVRAADLVADLVAELAGLADGALAGPSLAADAAADSLAEASSAVLLAAGAVPASRGLGGGGRLLSVRAGGQVLYPVFQFASAGPYRQHELVAGLWQQLGADADPAGAAAWWLTPNPWLSACPADLLGTARESEISYAADQLTNDSW